MIKAILIDDEPSSLKTLQKDLETYCPTIDIVATCPSGKEGLMSIHKHKPDLLFLDIDMPNMTGFEMLQCLERIYFDIIFTTAHQQYAVDAFRVENVVDYLLKPIKKDDLIVACRRASQREKRGISHQQLQNIENNYYATNQNITLRSSKGLGFIKIDEIEYASSSGNYITIYLHGKGKSPNSPYCTFTLSYLEDILPTSIFCRIHQSHLININYAVNYDRGEKYIEMKGGKKLAVSKGGRGKLLSKLKVG